MLLNKDQVNLYLKKSFEENEAEVRCDFYNEIQKFFYELKSIELIFSFTM